MKGANVPFPDYGNGAEKEPVITDQNDPEYSKPRSLEMRIAN